MDDLSLSEVEAEIRRAEAYLRSDVFNPTPQKQQHAPLHHGSSSSPPSSALLSREDKQGGPLEGRRPWGAAQVPERRRSLTRSRSPPLPPTRKEEDDSVMSPPVHDDDDHHRHRSTSEVQRRDFILARLAQEHGRVEAGGGGHVDGASSPYLLDPTASDDDDEKRPFPSTSTVDHHHHHDRQASCTVPSGASSLSRAGSYGEGGLASSLHGKGRRYETEAGREALLERLLSEYREGKKKKEEQQQQQEAARRRPRTEVGGEDQQSAISEAPGSPGADYPRYEHLVLGSPMGSDGEEGRLFYASDLVRELEEKRHRREDGGEGAAKPQVDHHGGNRGYDAARHPRPAWEEVIYGRLEVRGQETALEAREDVTSAVEVLVPSSSSRAPGRAKAAATHGDAAKGPEGPGGKGVGAKAGVSEGGGGGVKRATSAPRGRISSECTFKPQVNDYQKVTQKPRPPLQETIANLARPQVQMYADRERVRREKEAKQVEESCTFRPKLCKGTEKRARERVGQYQPVPDRLFQRLEEAAISKISVKCQVEEEKMLECTFKPQINPDSAAIVEKSYRPIHERLGDIQRAKRDHLNALRESAELHDPNLTFQPRICSNSERMARSRRGQQDGGGEAGAGGEEEDVGARLVRESKRFNEQRMRKLLQRSEEQWREYQPVPTVSKGTERLARKKQELQLGFLERQTVLGEKQRLKAEKKRAVYMDAEKRWFKPSIGKAQEVLLKKRPEHAKENIEQRIERLASQEMLQKEQERAKRAEEYYSRYTFEPEINRVSQLLGRPSSTKELVHNWRADMARVRLMQEAEERHKQECTFSPQLVTKRTRGEQKVAAWQDVDVRGPEQRELILAARGSTPHRHQGRPPKPRLSELRDPDAMAEELDRYRREKEEYVRQVQAEKEIEELQQCTFQPATNKRRPRSQTPVVVRGLGKYLEKREQALKLQKEKEDRERVVFSVRGAGRRGADGSTLVQPFQLSEGVNKRSKENVRREVECAFRNECTFTPRTIEAAKKEAIRLLLNDDIPGTAGSSRREQSS